MESALHSIGQISVTLVGFAALLKAFHRENETDPHTDPRLQSIVEQGLVVVLLCFLPNLLVSFELSLDSAARIVSSLAAIWLMRWLNILYHIRKAELTSSIAKMFIAAVGIHICAFISFLLAATNIIGLVQPLYFSGVILVLILVGWAFLAQFRIERSEGD